MLKDEQVLEWQDGRSWSGKRQAEENRAMVNHNPEQRPDLCEHLVHIQRWNMLDVGDVFFSASDKPKVVISYKTETEAEMLQLCGELREQFGERQVGTWSLL